MKITISHVSGIPIYAQIKQQIIEAILSETLFDHDKLPSLRQLAHELQVSVLTVSRAYTELEQEGFIQTQHGKGSRVVLQSSDKVIRQLVEQIKELAVTAVELSKQAGIEKENLLQIISQCWEEKE